MASTTNSMWRRIGDSPVGIGINRYEDSNHNSLWRVRITRINTDDIFNFDARVSDLREIQRFCADAINALETDGERHPPPAPAIASTE